MKTNTYLLVAVAFLLSVVTIGCTTPTQTAAPHRSITDDHADAFCQTQGYVRASEFYVVDRGAGLNHVVIYCDPTVDNPYDDLAAEYEWYAYAKVGN